MVLSPTQIGVLGQVMQTLAEPHEEAAIRTRVGELVLQLLGAQHYASYVWDDGSRSFGGGVHINMDPANLLQYERHYQYHDPITPLLQQHRSAVLVRDVLPRSELMRSEFFNDFLGRDGLHWGINLYAWSGDSNIGDMRIWRDRRRADFDEADRQLLDLLRPAFTAALRRCRPEPRETATLSPAAYDSGAGMAARLSEREREVAQLAASGLADKEIARRLGIAITTVRTHIDHAFRKLGVDNRMKLANKLGR